MISINTNLSSLTVQSNLKNSTVGLNNAIQRMTSGFKINGAKDNAAGYSISTSLNTKICAYQIAEDNVSMGLDMVQTASNSLSQMSDLTSRLRSLAVQASNGTYGNSSLDSINSEADAIVKELFRIQNTTSYNGITILNGGTKSSATSPIAVLAASAQTTSSPKAGASGFIEEVQRRDTSAMTTLASVDENAPLSSGTYSISTADELAKLATMTNSGKVWSGTEFVLANDIDLSAYSTGEGWTPIGGASVGFVGTFDGNGYKIKNLYINRPHSNYQGLFGRTSKTIKNVSIENVNVTGNEAVAGLVGDGGDTTITNSYSTGSVTGQGDSAGGLVGWGRSATIINSYSKSSVTGNSATGGLIGYGISSTITNSYATGNVTGNGGVGGLVGNGQDGDITNSYSTGSVTGNRFVGGFIGGGLSATITNCYSTGYVTGNNSVGGLVGYGQSAKLDNAYYVDKTGQTAGIGAGTPMSGATTEVTQKELNALIKQGILTNYLAPDLGLTLQVGIHGDDSSQIGLTFSQIDISSLDGLSMSNKNAIDTIDEVLKSINEQQTNLGSAENRLMSALEQISVAYDNLVSSRSTIRNADIAQESSNYIKMQILQQASATLLATANQNPSIALQLI